MANTHGPSVTLAALAVLTGCAGAPGPPAEGPPAGGPLLPIVRLEPGRADTLDLAARLGTSAPVRLAETPGLRTEVLDDGRVVVGAADGFADVALVPVQAGSETYALAVDAALARGLALQVEGPDPEDPSLLRFSVRRPDGGALDLDEEEGVVVLLDDRPYPDNAVDAFGGTAVLDLDAAGPGRARVRLAVRTDGLVSDWVEIGLVDGRPAEPPAR